MFSRGAIKARGKNSTGRQCEHGVGDRVEHQPGLLAGELSGCRPARDCRDANRRAFPGDTPGPSIGT